MKSKAKANLISVLTVFSLCLGAAEIHAQTSGTVDTLGNGMELILVENHGSPMIASVIFVRSGSKYESRYENGITHFLEHLLFDGTINLTREQLDRSIRDLGGYINAFTQEDLTAYLVLMPKQFIDYGLTVQADMLFNSIIPESELPKERQVVIEEIKRTNDAPGAMAEEFFRDKAYGNTDYGRPVLGYESFIANIPRDAIVAYWKKHYTPENMTALLIGDFDSRTMKKTIHGIFESIPRGQSEDSSSASARHRILAQAKQRNGQIAGQQRYDTVAAVTSTYINFSIAAPELNSKDYLAFDLLTKYLALDEISPLMQALTNGTEPLATEVSVSLPTWSEFSRLDISVITEHPELRESIVQVALGTLSQIALHDPNPADLRGITTSIRCDAIYNAEKLHYYGFIVAPMMMSAGWDWIQRYPDRLDSVTWSQCQTVAQQWLTKPNYVVTVVAPADSGAVPYKPTSLDSTEVVTYFNSAKFPSYELEKGVELTYPQADSIKFDLVDKAIYRREVMENGLTVLVKSSRDSRVFAANILGKNRSASERDDQAGITDFVNRCLAKGTLTRSAQQLTRDLGAIGANLTLNDNPWIPYDDRYTTHSFSFIKFETIEPYADSGFSLLSDIVMHPSFDTTEIENVRREMLGILGRSATSPSAVARDLYYGKLFEGHPFGKAIMGSPRTIGSITADDLRNHYRSYYSPGNMILSIVTSRDTAEVMKWARQTFGTMPKADSTSLVSIPELPPYTSGPVHTELPKEQIAIQAGGRLPGVTSDESLDLQVATSVLSSRLWDNLREKQGLAYSTGAGADFDRDFGWYYVSIATGSENYQTALDGLILQTQKLAFDGPQWPEVRSACNQMWGRLMSAKLSRINQAYYLGLDEFMGRATGYDRQLLQELMKVSPEMVRNAANKYFRTDLWVVASAGKKP
jgi:zinc protease